jgi:hypothetical protein
MNNECILVLFALMFIYFSYKINKLENNKENFDTTDPNTVAIANLNNLASSILNSNTLNIPTNTTISGDLNIGVFGSNSDTNDDILFNLNPYKGGNKLTVDTVYCRKLIIGGQILTDSYGLNVNANGIDSGININPPTSNKAVGSRNSGAMYNNYDYYRKNGKTLYEVLLQNWSTKLSPDINNSFNKIGISNGGALIGVNANAILVVDQNKNNAAAGIVKNTELNYQSPTWENNLRAGGNF